MHGDAETTELPRANACTSGHRPVTSTGACDVELLHVKAKHKESLRRVSVHDTYLQIYNPLAGIINMAFASYYCLQRLFICTLSFRGHPRYKDRYAGIMMKV